MSTSPNAEPSAAPQGPTRYFAGYRIVLGLVVSALGAFALHWTHDPELSAFAIVDGGQHLFQPRRLRHAAGGH